MSNFFISTASMTRAAQASVRSTQEQLARKQIEVASGKIADVGLQLGHRASQVVASRQALAAIAAQQGANALTASRLQSSQSALTDIGQIANGFLDAVLAARGSAIADDQLGAQARTAMTVLADRLNSSAGGEFLFAGINSGEAPVVDYFAADGNPARASLLQAFQSKFGVSPTDPSVADITPEDMSDFISNELTSQFSDAAWSANWSKATSETPTAMLGPSEKQEVGVSANEPPFRRLAQALAMVVDLGGTLLKDATRAVVLQKATDLAGSAQAGIPAGAARVRPRAATDRAGRRATLAESRHRDEAARSTRGRRSLHNRYGSQRTHAPARGLLRDDGADPEPQYPRIPLILQI